MLFGYCHGGLLHLLTPEGAPLGTEQLDPRKCVFLFHGFFTEKPPEAAGEQGGNEGVRWGYWKHHTYLLQGFVIDETCGILGNFKLTLLYMLAELPDVKSEHAFVPIPRTSLGWEGTEYTYMVGERP